MALVSYLPGLRNADAWFARIFGFSRALALPPILLTLVLAPAPAWGDIYKWTDEQGNTVISNVPPVKSSKVSDVELLATATKPATQLPVAPSPRAATRTQQALEARIENLEHQLQAQQDAQQQADPQSSDSEGYYPTPAPPPPDPSYYSSYDAGYNPGYYPGYFNPWPPSYSFIVAPAKTFVRRPGFVKRPEFVRRPPVFVGRPPVFVGRAPVLASQPAFGFSRGASFGGGSMHRGRR